MSISVDKKKQAQTVHSKKKPITASNTKKNNVTVPMSSAKTIAPIDTLHLSHQNTEQVQTIQPKTIQTEEEQSSWIDTTCDVIGDVGAGIAGGVLTTAFVPILGPLAPVAGAIGGAVIGAGLKAGIGFIKAKAQGKKFTVKNLTHDLLMGGANGALGAVTFGLGGAVAKGVTKALAKVAIKEGAKNAITFVAKEGVIGAAFGASNEMARQTSDKITDNKDYSFSNLALATGEGALLGPVMAKGFQLVGKALKPLGKLFRGKSRGKSEVKKDAVVSATEEHSQTHNIENEKPKEHAPSKKVSEREGRQTLREKLLEGKKVTFETAEQPHKIEIPKAKLAAPNAKFEETPESFATIIRKHSNEIKELMKIKDDKEYYEKLYQIYIDEMGLGELAPHIEYLSTHANARCCYSATEHKIYIFENNFPKNRAMGSALIAHELKHMLQFKEMLKTSGIGFEGIVKAQAKDVMKKNPNLTEDEALSKVYSWYIEGDDLKPHIYDLLLNEGYPENEINDIYGKIAQKLLKNEEHYIDKSESLVIDGTLKHYEGQISEQQSYDVGDAVGTEFNRSILGKDEVMHTRESEMQVYSAEKPKTEVVADVPSETPIQVQQRLLEEDGLK